MSASLRPLLLEEFLDWEQGQAERYEFDGVQPVAMTGGSVAHARLVRRLLLALASRLPARCEAFGGDLKVVTSGRARYPDATIVCGRTDPGSDAVSPTVIFEVLSPSTALTDRRVKPGEYASLSSVLAYVLLEQDGPAATILRRSAEWREEVVTGRDALLELPEVDIELPLAALYS
jgi:Uma2 family endonuclease